MTITSNIHVGLAGWSNATYVVGARRSNAGNAYQVTTAGTSTSPPSGTGSSITPGGTSVWKWLSAIDYSTLQAWASGIPTTLTQPVIGLVWNDAPIMPALGTTVLTMSGHTTSSTNNITIRPAPGEGFRDVLPTTPFGFNVSNGVCIQCPSTGSGGVNYIVINDNYFTFEGIQFWDPNSASNSTIIQGSGQNFTLSKCIIDGYSQPGGANIFGVSANGTLIVNCLIIDRGTSIDSTIHAYGASGVHVLYTTFYAPSAVAGKTVLDCGSNGTNGTNFSHNNIFANFSTFYGATSGTPWATDHNAYTAASFGTQNGLDNGGSVYGITTAGTFVNPGTDFRIKSASSCINAGSVDALASDDAFGTTRPQGASPDIGAHELLSGSVIYRDLAVYLASSLGQLASQPTTFDAGYSPSQTNVGYLEYVGTSASSVTFPMDFATGLLLGDRVILLEFQQWAGVPTRDIAVPIDWITNTVSSQRVAFEAPLSLLQDNAVPYDAKSTQPSLPWLIPDFDLIDFDSDFGVSTFTIDPSFVFEYGGVVPAGVITPVDGGASVLRAVSPLAEWQLYSAFSFNQSVGLVWGAQTLASSSAPTDWGMPQVSRDTLGIVDWRALVFTNAQQPIEYSLSFRLDALVPADFATQTSGSNASSAEFSGSAGRDASGIIESAAALAASISVPQDKLSTSSITQATSAEFSMVRYTDSIVYPTWFGNLARDATVNTDAAANQAWDTPVGYVVTGAVGATIVATLSSELSASTSNAIFVAWDQILLTVALDGMFSMEVLRVAQRDIMGSVPVLLGKKAIGSSLTPDEWEEENEPS